MAHPIYPCLWFDDNAKAAVDFYCSVFKDSKIISETPVVVMFELNGSKFMALNGGAEFMFNEAVSLVVNCDTQEEIDYYWNILTRDGGKESSCGWLRDKYGLSWQIVPSRIGEWIADPVRGARVGSALMKMKKLDMETLANA